MSTTVVQIKKEVSLAGEKTDTQATRLFEALACPAAFDLPLEAQNNLHQSVRLPSNSQNILLCGGPNQGMNTKTVYMLYEDLHTDPNLSLVTVIRDGMAEDLLKRDASIVARYKDFTKIIKLAIDQNNITSIGVEHTPTESAGIQAQAKQVLEITEIAMRQRGFTKEQAHDLVLMFKGPAFYLYATGYPPLISGKIKIVGLESEEKKASGLKLAEKLGSLIDRLFGNDPSGTEASRKFLLAIMAIKKEGAITEKERGEVISAFASSKQQIARDALEVLEKFEQNKLERDQAVIDKLINLQGNVLVIRGRDHEKYIDRLSVPLSETIVFRKLIGPTPKDAK